MRLNYEISTNSGLFLHSLAAAIKGYGNCITNVVDVSFLVTVELIYLYSYKNLFILIFENR